VPPIGATDKDGGFSMARKTRKVTGGVDTHGETHHAAVVDALGRQLAHCQFSTTPRGYRALLSWLGSFGQLERVGVEGTGAYGAALSRFLHSAGVEVVEVDRPDRKTRRARGTVGPDRRLRRCARGSVGPGIGHSEKPRWAGGDDPGAARDAS
jgi:D-arabinose 1-dehydrogenase-like Zn-dependent alcohol dehydrogenase